MPTETPLTVPTILINGSAVAPDTYSDLGKTATSYAISAYDGPVTLTFSTDYTPASTATNQKSPTNRAEIRYTLNGKNPNLGSTFYDGTAITLTENKTGVDNTVIKAKVYNQGKSSLTTKVVINVR